MEHLSPIGRFLLFAAAFVILVAGMRASADLIVPFLMAIFIAVLCMPPIGFLRSKGVPHGLAVLFVLAGVVLLGGGVGTIFGASIGSFADDIPAYQARLEVMVNDAIHWVSSMGVDADLERLQGLVNAEKVFPLAGTLLSSLGNMMTNAFLIILTVAFIVGDKVSLAEKVQIALPSSVSAIESLEAITNTINHYMAIKAVISLLTGFLAWLLLFILGVDYAVLWATLAFLLNFVPTLGSLLAAVPAVLLALVQLGPFPALLTAGGYLSINTIVGNVIEPRVMGRGLGLSPLIVLVSLVFWGWVLGPVGMLLSVPLTMMVKISLEVFPDTRWIGVLMGSGDPAEELAALPLPFRFSDAHNGEDHRDGEERCDGGKSHDKNN